MDFRITDLQLIYGVAGAQEKFDRLVDRLVRGEHPSAQKIRVKKGDGGIDVYVGEYMDPAGIDVFQAKFFWRGLGKSQKDQIRKSFRRCARSTRFKTRKWTLCLPVDLSQDEREWFDKWRQDQSSYGVEIEDPWGEVKLESLLEKPVNRELKERFFKQEYLTQIREVHGMMRQLLDELGDRFRQEAAQREETKHSDAVARQTEYVKHFVESIGHSFEVQTRPPQIRWSDLHRARASGNNAAAEELERASKRLGQWRIQIQPSWISEHARFSTLAEGWSIAESCQVRSDGWRFPPTSERGRETGHDYISFSRTNGREAQRWALSQRGIFLFFCTIFDDALPPPDNKPRWFESLGFTPRRFLNIDVAIRLITLAFQFASKLADKAFDPGDGAIDVSVALAPTKNRVLFTWDDPSRLMDCYRATADSLANTWHCKRVELRDNANGLAVKAAYWFFERFNWHGISEDAVANLQRDIFERHTA